LENHQEKSQEEMVREAVKEAKETAKHAEENEADGTAGVKENRTPESAEEEVRTEEAESADASETAEGNADQTEEKDTSEAGEQETDKKSGKKLFGKKDKKDKKDEKIEELTDKLTRQMAEFDNFRKRTEKEKTQMYEVGAKDIIEKILPVVDNFESGLDAVKEEDKEDPFVQGMEKVYKQLMTTLE